MFHVVSILQLPPVVLEATDWFDKIQFILFTFEGQYHRSVGLSDSMYLSFLSKVELKTHATQGQQNPNTQMINGLRI